MGCVRKTSGYQPCQGWGREFESHGSLDFLKKSKALLGNRLIAVRLRFGVWAMACGGCQTESVKHSCDFWFRDSLFGQAA